MKSLRVAVFCLVVAMFFVVTGAVYAAATPTPPPDNSGSYSDAGIESLLYLQDWGCAINSAGNGSIVISGYTNANQSVSYIMVRLYLQRWNGSNWVDLGSWPFEKYSASSVNDTKGLQVLREYYYRTRASHALTQNGYNESAQSYSTSIYVN